MTLHAIQSAGPVIQRSDVGGRTLCRIEQRAVIDGREYSRWAQTWDRPPAPSEAGRWYYVGHGSPVDEHFPESVCPCGCAAVIPLCFASGENTAQCCGCGEVQVL